MRRHPDARLEARVSEILSDVRSAQGVLDFELTIDGVPVEPREIRYRADDPRENGSIAMLLEATLPGYWPPSIEDKEAVVTVSVEGVSYTEFRGRIRRLPENPTDSGDTQIEAYTSGEWLSRQEIGEEKSFDGYSVRQAIWETVTLNDTPYAQVDLSGVPDRGGPVLVTQPGEEFSPQTMRSEILGWIEDRADVVLYDDPEGTLIGTTLASLTSPGRLEPTFRYAVGEETREHAFRISPGFGEEGRYAAVVVRYDDPAGGITTVHRIEVDNRGVRVPSDVVFPVDAADSSPEAIDEALTRAMEVARALSEAAWSFEMDALILDPRILRGASGEVSETRTEGLPGALYEVTRRYFVTVTGYIRDPKERTATLLGTALKVFEEALPVSEEEPLAVSASGVVETPVVLDEYGFDSGGFFFNDEINYMGVDGSGFWIDEDLALSKTGVDVDGDLWVEE